MLDKSSPLPHTLFLKARFNILVFYQYTGAVFLPIHATVFVHLMVLNFVTIINLLVARMRKN